MPDFDTDLVRFEKWQADKVVKNELIMAIRFPEIQMQEHPKAVLLAGQPGAGKTQLSDMLIANSNLKAVLINGDDFRRSHPHYLELYERFGSDSIQMTSPFSSYVTERMIDELSDLHVNLVIEGTGRTVEVPQKSAELLTGKGYTVEMAIIATRPEMSLLGTLRRYYDMNEQGTIPRATAISAHDAVVKALPGNLDVLNDLPAIARITIWNRKMKCLFDSDQSPNLLPSVALLRAWNRPWTQRELQQAREGIEDLRAREKSSQLGQGPTIDELSRRVDAVGG